MTGRCVRGSETMLTLEQSYIDEMISHAREDDPIECCGTISVTNHGNR